MAAFELSLRARNRAPATRRSYLDSTAKFARFAEQHWGITAIAEIERRHVEAFIADELEHWRESTAATRFRILQQFFKHAVDAGTIEANPMDSMREPAIHDIPVPVFGDDELRRLVDACAGESFYDKRDLAIIRLLIDTGVRRKELVGMQLDQIDLAGRSVHVLGKGRQWRYVFYGGRTAEAIAGYLQVRAAHFRALSSALWIGPRGDLTPNGVSQMLSRRAELAHVDRMFPHRFRHTFAHRWLLAGGAEGDLQTLAGWRSREMLQRYGASARNVRAGTAHDRLALGDTI